MAGKVLNIKICISLKERSGFTGQSSTSALVMQFTVDTANRNTQT